MTLASGVRTPGASRAIARGSSALAALLLLFSSCASDDAARGGAGAPPIAYVEGDATGAIRRSLAPALALLEARGLSLAQPPMIVVHQDSAAFLAATGQVDPSLRAWTTWRTVNLMPLDSWSKHDDVGVRQRIAHELCHVALYQSFGSEARAKAARIPRFFEEGVCSVVAQQQRPDLATIAFVAPPMPFEVGFFVADPEVAYAAAHHAVAFLDRKLEPRWLQDVLLEAQKDGGAGCIERALLAVTGYDPASLWRAVVDSVAAARPT